MEPLILLDIDEVLNPTARSGSGGDRPELRLSDARTLLVRRIARCGRIAWVPTWPANLTAGLESQLDLEEEPLRVTLAMRESDGAEPTPKLRSVTRWLARMETLGKADWDSVVWIHDVLGPDAHEWAQHHGQPVLLEKPVPDQGLIEAHVVAVEVFLDSGAGAER